MKKLLTKIRSYTSILILVNVLVKSFRKGLKEVLFREEKEAGYLAHDQFDTCTSRAKAIIAESGKAMLNILSLAIAEHRKKFHDEDHSEEIADLSSQMSASDVSISTKGFWNY